jgi:hypothetical protein
VEQPELQRQLMKLTKTQYKIIQTLLDTNESLETQIKQVHGSKAHIYDLDGSVHGSSVFLRRIGLDITKNAHTGEAPDLSDFYQHIMAYLHLKGLIKK